VEKGECAVPNLLDKLNTATADTIGTTLRAVTALVQQPGILYVALERNRSIDGLMNAGLKIDSDNLVVRIGDGRAVSLWYRVGNEETLLAELNFGEDGRLAPTETSNNLGRSS